MHTVTLPRPRGFRLQAAADFYAPFTPGSGMAAAAVDRLTLAFRLDDTFEAAVVALREEGDGIVADYAGTRDEARVRAQIARMLGLDADGDAWLAVGIRDHVVGRLQAEFPGFFTAAKASPYDAATWGVIAPRMALTAAARVKMSLAAEYGDAVTLHGRTYHVFPAPEALARIEHIPELPAEKLARLHGIAHAARAGRLGVDHLRSLGEAGAIAELMTLRGVGPWAASHIYYRGAAPVDALPQVEPRVLHGAAAAYGIDVPSAAAFHRMAERWRPFRMWVCVLLSRHLARQGRWHAPGLAHERAAAGKHLSQRVAAARTLRIAAHPCYGQGSNSPPGATTVTGPPFARLCR